MMYFDIESHETVSEKELFHEWQSMTEDEKGTSETFADYLKNCLSKNGTLIPVYETVH